MRMISQDGAMDINYDLVHLSIAHNKYETEWYINARDRFSGKPIKLATYSSEKKAKAVFEAVSDELCKGKIVVMFSSDEEVKV